MADPDAPQRGNERGGPWLHWIQAGFQGTDLSSGKTLGMSSSRDQRIAIELMLSPRIYS